LRSSAWIAVFPLDAEHGGVLWRMEMPHVLINQARVHDLFLDVMGRSPTRLEPDYGLKVLGLEIASARPTAA
jgi:hypothetical protein